MMMSPLTQGRELKSTFLYFSACAPESPLTQGRELKLILRKMRNLKDSRPSRRGVN